MKNNKRISLIIGSIAVISIFSTPYLLYLHKFIDPDVTNYNTIFGNFKGGLYTYAQTYVYLLLSKITPLLLLTVWFLTNKHWWVHSLIIPISVYVFQIIAVINDSEEFVDDIEFIYTVPIAILIMVVLYFLRSKMSIYIQAVDLKKEMDKDMTF